MNITIVTVGKLKEKYLKQGIDEYAKRLGAYAKIEIVELADEKAPEVLSDSENLKNLTNSIETNEDIDPHRDVSEGGRREL